MFHTFADNTLKALRVAPLRFHIRVLVVPFLSISVFILNAIKRELIHNVKKLEPRSERAS